MANNMTKTKTAESTKMRAMSKSKAAQVVLVRILVIALVDVIVSTLFMKCIRSDGMTEFAFHQNVLPVLKIVFGVLCVLSIAYLVFTLLKKIDTSAYWVTPAMLAAITVYLTATAFLYDQFRMSPFLFFTMTVIGSVLFAVYYIYTILLYKK